MAGLLLQRWTCGRLTKEISSSFPYIELQPVKFLAGPNTFFHYLCSVLHSSSCIHSCSLYLPKRRIPNDFWSSIWSFRHVFPTLIFFTSLYSAVCSIWHNHFRLYSLINPNIYRKFTVINLQINHQTLLVKY